MTPEEFLTKSGNFSRIYKAGASLYPLLPTSVQGAVDIKGVNTYGRPMNPNITPRTTTVGKKPPPKPPVRTYNGHGNNPFY